MGKLAAIACGLIVLSETTTLAAASVLTHNPLPRDDEVPTVDLGYEVHTGSLNVSRAALTANGSILLIITKRHDLKAYTIMQTTQGIYAFSNIPYAEQPVGDRRFSVPVLPTGSSSNINNGSENVICMQAASERVLEQYAAQYGVSVEQVAEIFYATAGQTEDCLALYVYVPEAIFNNRTAAKGTDPSHVLS
jgi:hypothetical protein